MDATTNLTVQQSHYYDDVNTRQVSTLPVFTLPGYPVKPKGSLMLNKANTQPYYSDGLQWLPFLGGGGGPRGFGIVDTFVGPGAEQVYPTCAAAFAAGVAFIRIRGGNVTEPGFNFTGLADNQPVLIYIDEGLTLTVTSEITTNRDITFRGSGPASQLVFRTSTGFWINSTASVNAPWTVSVYDMTVINDSTTGVSRRLFAQTNNLNVTLNNLVIKNTTYQCNDNGFCFVVVDGGAPVISMEKVTVIGGGTSCSNAINISAGKARLSSVVYEGTYQSGSFLMVFSNTVSAILDNIDFNHSTNINNTINLAPNGGQVTVNNMKSADNNLTPINIVIAGAPVVLDNFVCNRLIFFGSQGCTAMNGTIAGDIEMTSCLQVVLSGIGTILGSGPILTITDCEECVIGNSMFNTIIFGTPSVQDFRESLMTGVRIQNPTASTILANQSTFSGLQADNDINLRGEGCTYSSVHAGGLINTNGILDGVNTSNNNTYSNLSSSNIILGTLNNGGVLGTNIYNGVIAQFTLNILTDNIELIGGSCRTNSSITGSNCKVSSLSVGGIITVTGDSNKINNLSATTVNVTGNSNLFDNIAVSTITITGDNSILSGNINSTTIIGNDNLLNNIGGTGGSLIITGTGNQVTNVKVANSNISGNNNQLNDIDISSTLTVSGDNTCISGHCNAVTITGDNSQLSDIIDTTLTIIGNNSQLSNIIGNNLTITGNKSKLSNIDETNNLTIITGDNTQLDNIRVSNTLNISGTDIQVSEGNCPTIIISGNNSQLSDIIGTNLTITGDTGKLSNVDTTNILTILGDNTQILGGHCITTNITGDNTQLSNIIGNNSTIVGNAVKLNNIDISNTLAIFGDNIHVSGGKCPTINITGDNSQLSDIIGNDLSIIGNASKLSNIVSTNNLTITSGANSQLNNVRISNTLNVTGNNIQVSGGNCPTIVITGNNSQLSDIIGTDLTIAGNTSKLSNIVSTNNLTITLGNNSQFNNIRISNTLNVTGNNVQVSGGNCSILIITGDNSQLSNIIGTDFTIIGNTSKLSNINCSLLTVTGDNAQISGSAITTLFSGLRYIITNFHSNITIVLTATDLDYLFSGVTIGTPLTNDTIDATLVPAGNEPLCVGCITGIAIINPRVGSTGNVLW